MSNYQHGIWAENLCSLTLYLKFYSILERRWRCHFGEIDIIATRGNVLAFIEVKKRGSMALAAESISARQRKRLQDAAHFYLSQNPQHAFKDLRFDAMLVTSWSLPQHIQNAWPSS